MLLDVLGDMSPSSLPVPLWYRHLLCAWIGLFVYNLQHHRLVNIMCTLDAGVLLKNFASGAKHEKGLMLIQVVNKYGEGE